jgi:alginate O-acetyltransferase complex protein AlgJ
MQIDFTQGGNSDEFVVSGFSKAERLGRWSMGIMSQIKLPVPAGVSGLELQLALFPITAPGQVPEQSLTVIANGKPIHTATLSGWQELHFALPASASGELTLQFLHPTPVVPADLGSSADSRPLAFFFRQITLLVPQPKPQAADTTPSATPLAADAVISPDVRVARDGWLFLTGGSNSVIRYYTDPSYFTAANAVAWAALLIGRKERLERCGVRYLHLAAPDKISVYPDMIGLELPHYDRHPIAQLEAALAARGVADTLVNPLPAFNEHSERERLFLKTDTHWWYIAGMTVLQLVTQRLGFPRHATLEGRKVRRYRMTFDLGNKIDPPITEEAIAVSTREGVTRVFANELAQKFEAQIKARKPVVHNGINVVFRNENADAIDKRLVIFGDSLMDFQESTTTLIFAEHFRETHFVWSPRIDYGYVARVQADIVMTETAERFMIQLPKDDYNLDRDVLQRLASYPA